MWVYDDQGKVSRTQSMAVKWQGYLIAGGTGDSIGEDDGFVIATDSSGQAVWKRRYGWADSSENFSSVLPVSAFSEQALLAGRSKNPEGSGSYDGWLTRIDGAGGFVWSRLWGGPGEDYFNHLVRTSDGNYLAVGQSHSFSDTAACWLVKFAPDGEKLWERLYDSDTVDRCLFVTEIVDPSEPGGKALLMHGNRWEPYKDVVVFKLKTNGEVKWQRRILGMDFRARGASVAQILDGGMPAGFMVGATTWGSEWVDEGLALRLNDDGDYDDNSWAKIYYGGPGYGEGEIHSVVRTASGSFVYGGYTKNAEASNDAWIFATDEYGTVLWSRSYGGWDGMEMLGGVSSLGVLPFGWGLYAAGWSQSWSDNWDPWAFVMDEQGRIPGCSMYRARPANPQDVNVVVEDPGLAYNPQPESVVKWLKEVPSYGFGGKDMKLCPLDCLYKVDENSTAAAPDGKEWETAFSKLQDGIEIASVEALSTTQGRCEVWVAEGKYHAYQSSVEDSFALAYKVHMYGGFPGEDSGYSDYFNDREWEDHQTILTGFDEGGTERVYHVVTGLPAAQESVMDGFYVQDGLALGETEEFGNAGAGIALVGASPAVRNCELRNNFAAGWGAGAFVAGGEPLFQGVRFVGNGYFASIRTAFGGGVYNQDTGAVYRGCSFTGNRARFYGGGMATAMFDPAAAAPKVLDSTFTMNEAPAGSAILTYNDPATTSPFSAQFHVNLLVHGNQSTGWEGVADGSILTWGAGQSPSFVHCTVADNTGALLTGGLQAVESNPLVVNSIFWGNHGPGQDCEVCSDPAWDPSVWYSNIEDGWTGTGDGNIDEDPDFVIGGYYLGDSSPCIDTAFDLPSLYPWITEYVTHDLDQQSRPVGAGYDMGCYERQ